MNFITFKAVLSSSFKVEGYFDFFRNSDAFFIAPLGLRSNSDCSNGLSTKEEGEHHYQVQFYIKGELVPKEASASLYKTQIWNGKSPKVFKFLEKTSARYKQSTRH